LHARPVTQPLLPPPPTPSLTPQRDKAYISTGYDATTHFETTVEDVLDLYRRITGETPNLDSKNPRVAEQQQQE
jgi:Rab GDP dissociation inhibitor